MSRQRKAFPSKTGNRQAIGRRRLRQLEEEEKERKRQQKLFDKLKRGR